MNECKRIKSEFKDDLFEIWELEVEEGDLDNQ
jgi:hypothetical protein